MDYGGLSKNSLEKDGKGLDKLLVKRRKAGTSKRKHNSGTPRSVSFVAMTGLKFVCCRKVDILNTECDANNAYSVDLDS